MKEECENEGCTERYGYCKASKTIDMIGRIHHDMFQQENTFIKQSRHKFDIYKIGKWVLFAKWYWQRV